MPHDSRGDAVRPSWSGLAACVYRSRAATRMRRDCRDAARHAGLVIRDFHWPDHPAVVALWKATGRAVLPEDELREALRHGPGLMVVADHSTAGVVGVGLGTFDGRRGWIQRLAVHPEHRREGVGSMLVTELERRLMACGAARVNLLTMPEDVGAHLFWQQSGYGPCPDVLFTRLMRPEGHVDAEVDVTALDAAWDARWAPAAPVPAMLLQSPAARVGFRHVPEPPFYVGSGAEEAEAWRRYRAVLGELLEESGQTTLIAVACAWARGPGETPLDEHLAASMPRAVHWRSIPSRGQTLYASQMSPDDARLRKVVMTAVEDQADGVLLLDARATWIVHPSLRSMLVFARDGAALRRLRERHPDWVPVDLSGDDWF